MSTLERIEITRKVNRAKGHIMITFSTLYPAQDHISIYSKGKCTERVYGYDRINEKLDEMIRNSGVR